MKLGLTKMFHQPVVRISSGVRIEETRRPKVGIVQMTAMTMAAKVAHRDVRRCLTRLAFPPPVALFL